MTKKQIFNIIKVTALISIVGGIIYVKTREAEINHKWNSPEFQKTLRELNSSKQKLFNDNDFNVNLKQNDYLYFNAKVENPFNEVIEQSKLSLKLILTYKKGTIKYTSVVEDNKPLDRHWDNFDFSEYFKGKNFNFKDLQWFKGNYIFAKNAIEKLSEEYKYEKNNSRYKENIALFKQDISDYKIKNQYSELQINELEKILIEFEKYFDKKVYTVNHFKENENYVFNSDCNINLKILEDFTQLKDTSDINKIPTINLFKVKKATLEVYLEASNTNGFYYNDQVKSIDITNKWNDHFVTQKDDKTTEFEISNTFKITIPNSLEQRASNSDTQKVMKEFKDKYDEIKGVKIERSQIVFQPKGTNELDANKIIDDTKIFIKHSKNNTNEKLPNWNEKISSELKNSIEMSIKEELIHFYNKAFPNIELDWLPTENGKANNNVFTKISCLVNTGNDISEISSYLFFNINENVMITYSRNKNKKTKWDRIFIESLETFDFKNKK